MNGRMGWAGPTVAAFVVLFAAASAHAQAAEEAYFMDEARSFAPSGDVGSDGNAQGQLGSERMRRANRVASALLRHRMASARPSDMELLSQAREAEIIVAAGQYDRVQDVLAALELNHVVIPANLIGRLPLMTTQTLVINCGHQANNQQIAPAIQRFVNGGGYLVTTDWALNLVSTAFPGTIQRGGRNTADDVVQVTAQDPDHSLLQHVHSTRDELRWWLENSSYPIQILNRRNVEVLLTSRQMATRYGHAPIVVTFEPGEGRVLHTTSHYFLQQTQLEGQRARSAGSSFARDLGVGRAALDHLRRQGLDEVAVGEVAGAYAMQQLISNLIVEKRRRNEVTLRAFRLQASASATLHARPAANSEVVGEIGRGFLLRELDRRNDRILVRDLFGREGWMAAAQTRSR